MAVRGFRSIDKNALKIWQITYGIAFYPFPGRMEFRGQFHRGFWGAVWGEFSEAKPCRSEQELFCCATAPGQRGCCLSLSWQQLLVIRSWGITCRARGARAEGWDAGGGGSPPAVSRSKRPGSGGTSRLGRAVCWIAISDCKSGPHFIKSLWLLLGHEIIKFYIRCLSCFWQPDWHVVVCSVVLFSLRK